jgi:UDP-glucose 4-epimerase
MSLEDAVHRVLFAFEHGKSGDLFVNKAPAGNIGDLAEALQQICSKRTELRIIGTRHGEKLYETLCTREEMMKAEDMGDFYRIPADNRDLNYGQFFSEGTTALSEVIDYHSHNAEQLDVREIVKVLRKLPLVKKEVFGESFDSTLS